MITIKTATYTLKGDNSKCILSELCPFPRLRPLDYYEAPNAERWYPHAVLLLWLFIGEFSTLQTQSCAESLFNRESELNFTPDDSTTPETSHPLP